MYIILAIIAAFIVMLPFNKKKALGFMNFMLDNAFWIFLIDMIVGVALATMDLDYTTLYDETVSLAGFLIVASPFLVARSFIKKMKGNKNEVSTPSPEIDIPKDVPGRANIIKKFSERFNLNLTDLEVDKIASGSFQSIEWAREIAAMNRSYNTISEWYNSDTDWLRAYLKAFYVQNVSSDFEYQKQLCINNFNEIFASINVASFPSIDACIVAVNNRFMTNFDDVSFMIAYRFLESNGHHYNLPSSEIVQVRSELDELESRYRAMNSDGSNGML